MPFERARHFGAGLNRLHQTEDRRAGDGILLQRLQAGGFSPPGMTGLGVEISDQLAEPGMIAIFLFQPGEPRGGIRQGRCDHFGRRSRNRRSGSRRGRNRGFGSDDRRQVFPNQLIDVRSRC